MIKELTASGLALAACPVLGAFASPRQTNSTIRVAAVQMNAKVGDVAANLEIAEMWVRFAFRRGAKWVVLPEFFTSGMSFDPRKMLDAHRPLEGEPTQFLVKLAKEGGAFVAGSFLAQHGNDVYNTLVLATPDGSTYTHDKDFPSAQTESSFYAGGEDGAFAAELKNRGVNTLAGQIPSRPQNNKSGVFELRNGMNVGSALCWEQVRYRTAKRLRSKVDIVLAASAWPTLDVEVGVPGREKEVMRQEFSGWRDWIRRTPKRLARLVGAPVIHANLVGDTWSYYTPEVKIPVLYRFMGESEIVDAYGKVLAQRPYSAGEGLVIANVTPGRVKPSEDVPEGEFWTSDFSELCKGVWYQGGAAGRDYYLTTAKPHRNSRP
jgi:predicted amidohydrolase